MALQTLEYRPERDDKNITYWNLPADPDKDTTVMKNVDNSTRSLMSDITGRLSNLLPTIDQQANEEKSILQKFAERKTLAEKGAEAQKKLTTSEYGTKIEDEQKSNVQKLTSEQEARRGFATNTAVVRDIEETGKRRILDLEKARDELLLKADILKAEQIDNLLVKEQELITNSRKDYLSNLGTIAGLATGLGSYETPDQKRQKELQTETQKSVINLMAKAPDVGITQNDDIQTAMDKYRKSSAYKNDTLKGELELDKLRAEIRYSDAQAAKARASGRDLSASEITSFNSIVNRYSTSPLIAAADRAQATANIIPQIEANPSSREFQLAAIYQFIQILDNYQSAVREGEIGLLTGTQSLSENIQTSLEKLNQGKAVNEKTILDITNGMKALVNSINDAASGKEKMFASQANTVGLGNEWTKFRAGFQAPYEKIVPSTQSIETDNSKQLTSQTPEKSGDNLSNNLFRDLFK